MNKTNFAQSQRLLGFYLRRDWLKILFWLIGLAGLMIAAAGKFDTLYGSAESIAAISVTLKSPAMVAMFGPFTTAKPLTTAIIYASEMMVFMGLFTAMMNIHFAIKNTRAEEDTGLTELVRAHAVGRNSQLLATIFELIVINLVIGVIEALGLQFSGMTGVSANGSWLFAMGLAAFGMMFSMISIVCAQLVSNSRNATMISYGVLGILYIGRMSTDVQNPNVTWWTIFGWIEKLDVYHTNNWWPLVLMLGLAVILGIIAITLANRRDIGTGILPGPQGRIGASNLLMGSGTLLIRLERINIIAWSVGLFVLGMSYGSIFGNVGDLMKTNPTMAHLIGSAGILNANRTVILSFASTLTTVFAVVASIPVILLVLQINRDERKGYLEQLHARGVSRQKIMLTYIGMALFIGTMALGLGVLGMGLAGNATLTHPIDLTRYLTGFIGYWPSLLVVVGIAAVIMSCLPRWQNITWLIPTYGFLSLYLGKLLNFPTWAQKITPYGWVPAVPLKHIDWATVGLMTGCGILLIICAMVVYHYRDLTTN